MISGEKRGEVLNKTSKIVTSVNANNTHIHEINELVEDTIELLNAVNKTSKRENKANSGFNLDSNTINGNTTVALSKFYNIYNLIDQFFKLLILFLIFCILEQWIKSKELVDYVETTSEG